MLATNTGGDHIRVLEGVRICLVFEWSLSHYTRILQEIDALRSAGADIVLVTSHPRPEDAPPGIRVVVAPLDVSMVDSPLRWRPARISHNIARRWLRQAMTMVDTGWNARLRRMALNRIARDVDVFWVVDYPSLATTLDAAKGSGARLVYETVDLVPEYAHFTESQRKTMLEEEQRLISNVDSLITACDGYADYYVERYSAELPSTCPLVRNDAPATILGEPAPIRRPLRALFLGSLMHDRPVFELIDAMALLRSGVSLTFQGKNLLGDEPARRIAALGLQDRVRIIAPCPPDEIVDTASRYDIGIVALRGLDENERRASTTKLFTYMAAGLIVLGSNLPGIARIVQTFKNGLLVTGGEPGDWAAAIDLLAQLPSEALESMKANSLVGARAHSWETQMPAFVDEFSRVADKRRSSDRHPRKAD